MHSDNHPSHSPVPTPLNAEQKQFAHAASDAAQWAMEDFDTRIKNEVAGQSETAKKMRALLRSEYDWTQEELSIKEAITQLESDKAIYLAVANQLHSADNLYHTMEMIANNQIEALLFGHNNYPLATLRHDQFVHFLGSVSDALRDQELLSPNDRRFDDLITGYHCAMLGYDALREQVMKRSKGQYASLLEWTGASTLEKNPDADGLDEKKFETLMTRRYRAIFRDWGLNIQGKSLVPVAYAYLADLAEKISVQEVINEHPEVTDTEKLKELAQSHRRTHMQHMTQLHTNLFSFAEVAAVEQYLLDAYATAFHLPKDFSTLSRQATDMAKERTEAALPRIEKQASQHLATVHTKGREKLEAAGMFPYQSGVMQTLAKPWFHHIGREIASADNPQQIIQIFQEDADIALLESSCAVHHPGMIHLRRSYAEAFSKALETQWKEQISDGHAPAYNLRALRQSFQEVLHKYDQAYECYWDIANWCLQATHGAYSDFGQLTLNVEMAAKGKDFNALTRHDMTTASKDARECIMSYAIEHGVPEAWAEHPLMPRLYQTTLIHAAEQENRRMAADFSLFPHDRSRNKPWDAHELEQIKQATIAAESSIQSKQHDMLQAVVKQFPSGYPDRFGRAAPAIEKTPAPYHTTPYIDAATLARIQPLIELDRPTGRQH